MPAVGTPELGYASSKAQLTREGDEFILTIPPRETAMQFWVSVLGATGFAVFCVVGALWPAGDTHVGGMVVGHPGGALARVFFLGLAGFSVFLTWQQFRIRGHPATLSVRGRALVVRLPGAWGDSNEHFDLSDFSGAEIVKDEDRELARAGRTRRCSGSPTVERPSLGLIGPRDGGPSPQPHDQSQPAHAERVHARQPGRAGK